MRLNQQEVHEYTLETDQGHVVFRFCSSKARFGIDTGKELARFETQVLGGEVFSSSFFLSIQFFLTPSFFSGGKSQKQYEVDPNLGIGSCDWMPSLPSSD